MHAPINKVIIDLTPVRRQAVIWNKYWLIVELDYCKHISVTFETTYKNFHTRKLIRKCHLQNDVHFVSECVSAISLDYRTNTNSVKFSNHTTSEFMMTSLNGNIFRVTGLLWWESTGHRWFTLTEASDAELGVFFDLCLDKSWADNPDAGDLRRHRAHYEEPPLYMEMSHIFYFMTVLISTPSHL